ncbi:MAG: hypothetical protein KAT66_01715 [Candidatus Lokiarchaeota archaeon]|nr:hypothetical protein [Candidatus Lokiarchaeota archaeon]
MIFNNDAEPVFFIIWLILATIIVALIIYIVVFLLESKTKASDKWIMILILAFLIVLVLPIVLNAVTGVLDAIGRALEDARDSIDPYDKAHNYLILLAPVIGFLILLVLVKFLIDIPWGNAVWVSLLILFVLYILFTLIPELYTFIYEYVPE